MGDRRRPGRAPGGSGRSARLGRHATGNDYTADHRHPEPPHHDAAGNDRGDHVAYEHSANYDDHADDDRAYDIADHHDDFDHDTYYSHDRHYADHDCDDSRDRNDDYPDGDAVTR